MVAHLPSLGVVPPFGQLSECVYSLHQNVQCLQQSFYCFYTASVSTAYTKVFIAYSRLSIAFTQRVGLQLTLECLLLTLVFLLLLHGGCVYGLHQSVYCLLSTALTQRVCIQLTLGCLYSADYEMQHKLVQGKVFYGGTPPFFGCGAPLRLAQRVCRQFALECLVLPIVFLLLLHSECVYSLHQRFHCLLQSFYRFYIASVSIAYTRVFTAYSLLLHSESTAYTRMVLLPM